MKKSIIALSLVLVAFTTQARENLEGVAQEAVLFGHCAEYTESVNPELSSKYQKRTDALNEYLDSKVEKWERDVIEFTTKRAIRGHKKYSKNVLRRTCLQRTDWVAKL